MYAIRSYYAGGNHNQVGVAGAGIGDAVEGGLDGGEVAAAGGYPNDLGGGEAGFSATFPQRGGVVPLGQLAVAARLRQLIGAGQAEGRAG